MPRPKSTLGAIVELQLELVNRRLRERGLSLELTDGARELILEAGWDPAYGARPLKRVIQKHVQDPLAEAILAGRVKDGDTVVIGAGPSGLVINGEPAKAAA